MVAISVIIPVYNAEKYLSECVESLLNQTLQSCEFIFVNDGSTDASQLILEKYSKKDKRVLLIHQENKGVSAARNTGIKAAQGEFLGFVDSDDYLEKSFYEKLYNTAKNLNASLVFTSFQKEQEGLLIQHTLPFAVNQSFNRSEMDKTIIPFLIANDDLNSVCTKIYKRSLIEGDDITFPEKMKFAEDAVFNFRSFCRTDSSVYINNAGYYYREVENSATHDLSNKDCFSEDLELFQFDYKQWGEIALTDQEVLRLKSIRLKKKILTNVYLYLKPNNNLSFYYKWNYTRKMLNNNLLKDIVSNNDYSTRNEYTLYHKICLFCIRFKLIFLLYGLVYYSYLHNKK